jgi:DNA mismatch repair protein MutS
MTLMQQYHAAKERHPNMLLLFRIGDFYEAYGDDAWTLARAIGTGLTTREKTVMAGFPHQALENYLRVLLKAGHRVAICDQVDDLPAGEHSERIVVPLAECPQPSLFDEAE